MPKPAPPDPCAPLRREIDRLREVNMALLAACRCNLAWADIEVFRDKFAWVLKEHGLHPGMDAAEFTEGLTRRAVAMAEACEKHHQAEDTTP